MTRISQTKFKPIAALQGDINSFWFLEEAQEVYNRNMIMPDSYRELIINLGAPIFSDMDNGEFIELPRAYLSFLQKRPREFRALGRCQIIAVSLYPWAAPALLNDDTLTDYNGVVALNKTWQDFAIYLQQSANSRGYEEAVAQLQQFVCDQWHPLPHGLAALREIGQLIYDKRGQLLMAELAAQCLLSTSQFERRFKQATSVAPKTYARLVRFEAIRNALIMNPSVGLADLAYEHGYTDQAHLTHDFKAFAAQTPGEFAINSKAYTAQWQSAEFLQYA